MTSSSLNSDQDGVNELRGSLPNSKDLKVNFGTIKNGKPVEEEILFGREVMPCKIIVGNVLYKTTVIYT